MGTGSKFFIILGLGFLSCIRNVMAQYYRNYPNLEMLCNQSLVLDCPFLFDGRAGTFRYDNIPDLSPGLCYFNVTLPPDCGISSRFFAFYINIRKFLLPPTDHVRIYQANRLAPRILLKELTGSHSARSNPSSVSQALTSYVKQPSFIFEYFRGTSPSTESNQAYIDFIIVTNSPGLWSAYCPALSGYVDVYFICHTDGTYGRVNCPHSFTPDVYAVNPASLRQSCPFRSPPSAGNNEPIYEYWNTHGILGSSQSSSLSSDAITGIVFGCILFVVIIITGVYMRLRSVRRRTPPSRPIVLPRTSGAVQLEPLLVTVPQGANRVPAVLDDPVAPPPPYLGAPPSYSQLTAAPALVSISLSNPPSYKSCI
ncbi:uncharacterized protein LOC129596516 [Paramacrobiotus metropolitanus]|uniref:uncharacterized protein LOC129596516 n=1 Tax=Paramacrobiotus metropolitanus TaxID=2943436 RepID=UPI00244575BC|nr:uncharacterized protein LOC129596516 [Paramacrobiotus metropolitanus]